MSDLLFELFCEEIPARMQRPAEEALSEKLAKMLEEARLEYEEIQSFVTPRRLAFLVSGLPENQPDQQIERKGPKVDAPEQAIEGFLRSTGLSKDDLEVRTVGKHDTYFAVIEEEGKATEDALHPLLEELIKGYTWPKSMRWGDYPESWVRPLQNICCLLGRDVIPVTYGPLRANNRTYGHRFLAPEKITISNPSDYESILEAAHVIADRKKREQMILEQMHETAVNYRLAILKDDALLEEVTGLVEWPVILGGEIDNDYMDLPLEVLRSEMRNHQKYFNLVYTDVKQKKTDTNPEESFVKEGELADKFLITSNLKAQDGGGAIIEGNERVLRARLADGRFYWDQDRKQPLSDWGKSLETMIFHAKLGTMSYRVERIRTLAAELCQYIDGAEKKTVQHAAQLAKADLTTGMVGEFPDLQGVMGRYYALDQGESEEVADAIRDHYLPMGRESKIPTAPTSVAVALADKIDSMAGLFAIGEKPTGSKDPFALRRAAIGIINILIENKLHLPLHKIFDSAINNYINLESKKGSTHDIAIELVQFCRERFRNVMRDAKIRHDHLEAVMRVDAEQDDFYLLAEKISSLIEFFKDQPEKAQSLLAASNRVFNILSAERKKGNDIADAVDPSLFQDQAEKDLWASMNEIRGLTSKAIEDGTYTKAFETLAIPSELIDTFFDKVTVNAENPNLRKNRLSMLANINKELLQLADFSVIEAA